jgi:hypothetical protein
MSTSSSAIGKYTIRRPESAKSKVRLRKLKPPPTLPTRLDESNIIPFTIKRRKFEDCINTFSYSIKFKSDKDYKILYKKQGNKSDISCRDIVKYFDNTKPILLLKYVSVQLFKPFPTSPTLVEVIFKNTIASFLLKHTDIYVFSTGLINSIPSSRAVFSINYDTLTLLTTHKSVIYVNLIDHNEYDGKNKFTILHYPFFRYLQVSVYYPTINDELSPIVDSNVNALY